MWNIATHTPPPKIVPGTILYLKKKLKPSFYYFLNTDPRNQSLQKKGWDFYFKRVRIKNSGETCAGDQEAEVGGRTLGWGATTAWQVPPRLRAPHSGLVSPWYIFTFEDNLLACRKFSSCFALLKDSCVVGKKYFVEKQNLNIITAQFPSC